ncbi:hypothetical protein CDL31_25295 [Enterobacter kobei]|nr:hypothetical protein F0324_05620 [Enterobacter kobei]OXV23577.1 hypothetical protein CDL31_25295 [Enterobacter kobei]
MSLSCYGLCYHNSNKKNFKSSLQSCQPEVNYGLHASGLTGGQIMALSGSKSYTLTIGNGPLAITIGTIHSASGLDASSHAEAPPDIKSFSEDIPRQDSLCQTSSP